MKFGLFASHGGTNLQAILDACANGHIKAEPAIVISNNSNSMALERAKKAGVPTAHFSSKTHPNEQDLDVEILNTLQHYEVDLIVLAGYMKRLGPKVVDAYRNRILNIHPALLPAYGGKGMYGHLVHTAVLNNGEKETGVSVHLVDEEYDQGAVLAQVKVPVMASDSVETLATRVLEQEHILYVETLRQIANGEMALPTL